MPADSIAAVRSTSFPVFPEAGRTGRSRLRGDFVKDLAVEGFFLGTDEFVALLLQYQSVTAVHAGLNGLTDVGVEALAVVLCKQRNLDYLDIWGNPGIGTPGALCLLSPLAMSTPCKLRTLNLSNCSLGAAVMPALTGLAARGFLRALSAANNPLGIRAGRELAKLVKCGVSALDFSDCGLGTSGIQPLAQVLHDGAARSCCLLALSWNNICQTGMEQLLFGAAQQVQLGGALEELFLRGSGFLTVDAAHHALDLAQAGGTFERLDLSRTAMSPEASELFHDTIHHKIELPSRVSEHEEFGVQDDAVYWPRRPSAGSSSSPQTPVHSRSTSMPVRGSTTPPAGRKNSLTVPPRSLSTCSGSRSPLPSLSSRPGAFADKLAVPDNVPVRNRRNENDAFEAFVVQRAHWAKCAHPGSQHMVVQQSHAPFPAHKPKRALPVARRPKSATR